MRIRTALLIASLTVAPVLAGPAAPLEIDDAVIRALEARLGSGAQISLESLRILTPPQGAVVDVQLAPGARLGQLLHVRLGTAGPRGLVAWTGVAEARPRIVVSHAHAAHALSRGNPIEAGDVEAVSHEITEGPIVPWPAADALVRGKVLRDLAAGACIGRTAVAVALAVQSGQTVVGVARVDGVEARASLVAAGSGEPGAIIRVVNQESRRVMKARVVSAGIVEIVP